MCLDYGSFSPRYCFSEITHNKQEKKSIHLNIKEEPIIYTKHSPVTLALTGSTCSFLFLPNSTPISRAPRESDTDSDQATAVFKVTDPRLLLAFPSCSPAASLMARPVSPFAFSLRTWYLFTYQGKAASWLLRFGQRSIPLPSVLVDL